MSVGISIQAKNIRCTLSWFSTGPWLCSTRRNPKFTSQRPYQCLHIVRPGLNISTSKSALSAVDCIRGSAHPRSRALASQLKRSAKSNSGTFKVERAISRAPCIPDTKGLVDAQCDIRQSREQLAVKLPAKSSKRPVELKPERFAWEQIWCPTRSIPRWAKDDGSGHRACTKGRRTLLAAGCPSTSNVAQVARFLFLMLTARAITCQLQLIPAVLSIHTPILRGVELGLIAKSSPLRQKSLTSSSIARNDLAAETEDSIVNRVASNLFAENHLGHENLLLASTMRSLSSLVFRSKFFQIPRRAFTHVFVDCAMTLKLDALHRAHFAAKPRQASIHSSCFMRNLVAHSATAAISQTLAGVGVVFQAENIRCILRWVGAGPWVGFIYKMLHLSGERRNPCLHTVRPGPNTCIKEITLSAIDCIRGSAQSRFRTLASQFRPLARSTSTAFKVERTQSHGPSTYEERHSTSEPSQAEAGVGIDLFDIAASRQRRAQTLVIHEAVPALVRATRLGLPWSGTLPAMSPKWPVDVQCENHQSGKQSVIRCVTKSSRRSAEFKAEPFAWQQIWHPIRNISNWAIDEGSRHRACNRVRHTALAAGCPSASNVFDVARFLFHVLRARASTWRLQLMPNVLSIHRPALHAANLGLVAMSSPLGQKRNLNTSSLARKSFATVLQRHESSFDASYTTGRNLAPEKRISSPSTKRFATLEEVVSSLQRIAAEVTNADDLDADVSLIEAGLDSLSATVFRASIVSTFDLMSLPAMFVHEYACLRDMASYLYAEVSCESIVATVSKNEEETGSAPESAANAIVVRVVCTLSVARHYDAAFSIVRAPLNLDGVSPRTRDFRTNTPVKQIHGFVQLAPFSALQRRKSRRLRKACYFDQQKQVCASSRTLEPNCLWPNQGPPKPLARGSCTPFSKANSHQKISDRPLLYNSCSERLTYPLHQRLSSLAQSNRLRPHGGQQRHDMTPAISSRDLRASRMLQPEFDHQNGVGSEIPQLREGMSDCSTYAVRERRNWRGQRSNTRQVAATGTILPRMKRNSKLPSDLHLPRQISSKLPSPDNDRAPVIRLLCFYGAGDNVCQEWAFLHHAAPINIELATYEFPGHGIRDDEQFLSTLDDLVDDAYDAVRDAMSTGAFAVLGHSIGTLVATGVCRRAKRDLGVEPVCAFMFDRGPPNMAVLSEIGVEMVKSDVSKFLTIWNPVLAANTEGASAAATRLRKMWQNDMQLERDVRRVGWHIFKCPLIAFRAAGANEYVLADDLSPETRQRVEHSIQFMSLEPPRVARKLENGKKVFLGFFGHEEMQAWQDWTEHPAGARVIDIPGVDHFGIKYSSTARSIMWEKLGDIIDMFERPTTAEELNGHDALDETTGAVLLGSTLAESSGTALDFASGSKVRDMWRQPPFANYQIMSIAATPATVSPDAEVVSMTKDSMPISSSMNVDEKGAPASVHTREPSALSTDTSEQTPQRSEALLRLGSLLESTLAAVTDELSDSERARAESALALLRKK